MGMPITMMMKPKVSIPSISGNMWVTSNMTNSVYKITSNGTITNYSGTGQAPSGIAFDGVNMFSCNTGFSVGSALGVSKIFANGTINPSFATTDYNPSQIAFDGTNMWTCNCFGYKSVTKITPAGASTTYNGIGNYSHGIAFDGTNMWTVSEFDASVSKITPTGTITTYTGTGGNAFYIVFDGVYMWTMNSNTNYISRIDLSGTITNYNIGFSQNYMVFDGVNRWISHGTNISTISSSGIIINTYSLGTINAGLMSFDGTYLWITDNVNNTISKVNLSGVVLNTYTGINNPAGIAFDGCLLSHWWGGS